MIQPWLWAKSSTFKSCLFQWKKLKHARKGWGRQYEFYQLGEQTSSQQLPHMAPHSKASRLSMVILAQPCTMPPSIVGPWGAQKVQFPNVAYNCKSGQGIHTWLVSHVVCSLALPLQPDGLNTIIPTASFGLWLNVTLQSAIILMWWF